MTTGTRPWDNRQLFPISGGPTLVPCGEWGSVTWNGRDQDGSELEDHSYLKIVKAMGDPYCTAVLGNGQELKSSARSMFGGLPYPPVLNTVWTSNDTIALYNKLGEKTNTGEFNPSVFLAQSGEALGMIAGTASSLAGAIRKVKKGDMRGAAKALGVSRPNRSLRQTTPPRTVDETTARWLELQYGWLPLLGDLDNAARALASTVEKPQKLTFRVKKRKVRLTDFQSQGRTNVTYARKDTCRKQMIVTLSAAPDPFKLTLADPATVAWELVPYSFVADWFLPIGDFMNAMRVRSMLPVARVVTSTKQTSTIVYKRFSQSASTGYVRSLSGVNPANLYSQYVRFDRTISSSLPGIPPPSVKNLDEVLSWRRAANAISLAWQAFR